MSDAREQVHGIIGEICGVDANAIQGDADIYREYSVDSMMAVRILASIDVQFNIEVPNDKAAKVRTVNQLVQLVESEVRAARRA